jgi:ADP-ribose pyrophosphatase YjhB (NUDIX family)
MIAGRILWYDVLPVSQAELAGGFDRRFDAGGRPAWEGVAALCTRPDGALLMVFQADPGETPAWALPGGSIEPHETPIQAVVRELREETGLAVAHLQPRFKVRGVYDAGHERFNYHIYYFVTETVEGALAPADPDGAILWAEWVSPERLCELPFSHDDQRQILQRYVDAPC